MYEDPAIANMESTATVDAALIVPSDEPQSALPDEELEHKYTVFAMNKQKGWSESKIKPLASFGTLNQFWAMY
jgi:hypothetical protein